MTTRAEHHAESDTATVQSAKDQIAWILERRTSRDMAISSKALAEATDITPTTVRDIIKEIRRERHLPIRSCANGYYLIESVEQLEDELDKIQAEINTRKETKQELVKAFNTTKYERD